MHFPALSRNKDASTLPTVEESRPSATSSRSIDEKRKDSGATPVAKPLPTRTASTRIQEPMRTPSHASHKPNVQRGASTRSTASHRNSKKFERPGLQRRRTTARTRYIDMLLGLDDVSPLHNFLASLSVWILLAGYIVFPATFTKLQNEDLDAKADTNLKQKALKTVRNVPLLYIAAFACGLGVMGCLWLWWKHRKNYVWVINRIFLPALLNSIAGLISTIVNIYSAQDGQYSVTAKITVIVTSACSVVAAALFLLYNTVMLKLVKRRHEREVREAERWDDGNEVVIDRERGVYTSRGV
ncbi:hypothetical protein FB567DRAFT_156858 [Paraphoma chrysanthemicola]|uniref:Uncharacterized protein n=1 Tax=Paraphoma chrysanthemicola TaxID=798071 RepID=A0A8K0QXJ5_9PLEO|nr:hypothetical protein FB567DRAFT_156858 [Paraphoma chrysanthemicola]